MLNSRQASAGSSSIPVEGPSRPKRRVTMMGSTSEDDEYDEEDDEINPLLPPSSQRRTASFPSETSGQPVTPVAPKTPRSRTYTDGSLSSLNPVPNLNPYDGGAGVPFTVESGNNSGTSGPGMRSRQASATAVIKSLSTTLPKPKPISRHSSAVSGMGAGGSQNRRRNLQQSEIGNHSAPMEDIDSSDPDANFFKIDTWNADDSDLEDDYFVTSGNGTKQLRPGLRTQASSVGSIKTPTGHGGATTSILTGTLVGGSVSSAGYVGTKGVGIRKDGIMEQMATTDAGVNSDEGKERTEWQNMLASVLGGEILKGEKSRIGGERPTSETFKKEVGSAFWWQIRAKLRGRDEDEERRRVQERRERTVDAILEEIERFKVVLPERFNHSEDLPTPEKTESQKAHPDEADTDVEALEEEMGADDHALEQILGMLNKLTVAESLYPHLNAMKAEKPLYGSPALQAKIDAMTSWVTVVGSSRYLLERLQNWTGSNLLDIAKPNTTAEKALVKTSRLHADDGSRDRGRSSSDQVADDSTFIERLLKEDSITKTFSRRVITDLYRLVYTAKQTIVSYSDIMKDLGLGVYETGMKNELMLFVNFPTRIIVEAMRVRLDAASRLSDPSELVIADMTDAFRRTMMMACVVKAQHLQIMEPDADGKWSLPPCVAEGFDQALLDGLRTFFKLLHWTLKSGSKAIYFRETEVLEDEWEFLYNVAESVEGGDVVVAENFCSLTNKLMVRVTEYFETQLQVPRKKGEFDIPATPPSLIGYAVQIQKEGRYFESTLTSKGQTKNKMEMTTEEMIAWFSKVLDAVKMRYRKLQRFARRLTQRFDNAAEYDIEDVDLDLIIESLDDTGHFMIWTQTFEQEGTYIIADSSLRERPDLIRQLLYKSFSSMPRSEKNARQRARDQGGEMDADGEGGPDGPHSSGNEGSDDEEDFGSYLLVFSPRRKFLWPGAIMKMDLPFVALKLRDNRIRLIADGPVSRLALCKNDFMNAFVDPVSGEQFLDLDCLVEQQAHLPRIQKELRRISKSTNRLSECIVESVAHVRLALKNSPGTQDLLENWYTFATEHGQRVGVHMDNAAWSKFSRLLMRLSISWVAFITDLCDPTDRKTFRWAVNALEYAMLMTRGNNILHLEQQEFALLKSKVASCMSLLISHFDILGARSALEAKKESERLEAIRRLQRIQENLDDEYGVSALPGLPPTKVGHRQRIQRLMSEVYGSDKGERSIRLVREQRIKLAEELDSRRTGFINDQHMVGTVLAEEVSDDRSLLFLASSSSNIALRWQQGGFIGGGANGNVYIGFNLDSGGIMAVKEIRVQDLSNTPALYKQIKDESDVMQMLSHPNIVEYYGIEVHRDRVYIFEEYCEGGSLADLLEHGRIEDEEVILVYTLQMLHGLDYLHSKGVEHRDVKPDNILLGANSMIKFVDFGAAKVIIRGNRTMAMAKSRAIQPSSKIQAGGLDGVPAMNSLAGTPMYMAPEVIKNEKTGIKLGAMDIWSMGCVILEFATGRKPWSNLDNEWAIMFHIGIATKHPPLPEPGQLSELGIDFIELCLTLEASKRPTAVELLAHPWLTDVKMQMAAGDSAAAGFGGNNGGGRNGGQRGAGTSSVTTGTTLSGTLTTVESGSVATPLTADSQNLTPVISMNGSNASSEPASTLASGQAQSQPSTTKRRPSGGVKFAEEPDVEANQSFVEETIHEDAAGESRDPDEDGHGVHFAESTVQGESTEEDYDADGEGQQPQEEGEGDEYVPYIDPDTGLEMYVDEEGRRYWLYEGDWHAEGEDDLPAAIQAGLDAAAAALAVEEEGVRPSEEGDGVAEHEGLAAIPEAEIVAQ